MSKKARKDRVKWENKMCRLVRETHLELGRFFDSDKYYNVILDKSLSIPEIRAKVKALEYSTCGQVRRIWDA